MRDVKIGEKEAYASEGPLGRTEVELVKVKPFAFSFAGPLEIVVVEAPDSQDLKTSKK